MKLSIVLLHKNVNNMLISADEFEPNCMIM